MKEIPLDFENQTLKICAFTGHRELEESFSKEKLRQAVETLVEKGVETFYCGMAKGFDLYAAEEIIRIKEKHKNVKFVACVPYYGQEKGYSETDKKRYVNALKKCDFKFTFTDTYYRGCEIVRDKFMVEQADVLVAYLKKKTGGTAYTVTYFQRIKPHREIIFL